MKLIFTLPLDQRFHFRSSGRAILAAIIALGSVGLLSRSAFGQLTPPVSLTGSIAGEGLLNATNSDISGWGLAGVTTSSGASGVGVYGIATSGGNGVYGESVSGFGVVGLAQGANATGILAIGDGGPALATTGGNVGIGTTSPQALLHINGNAVVNSGLTNLSTRPTVGAGTLANGEIRAISSQGSVMDDGFLRISAGAGTNAFVKSYIDLTGYSTIPDMAENIVLGTYGTERMRITGNGNVGIGTSSPQHLLSVAGSIGAQEIVVVSSGADYVFECGYWLAPLGEVADYIRANHHLPEIPSAAEVQEKGVSLGDMQARLLAKIEELTLHMIEADQRINDLERRNRQLGESMRGQNP